MNRHGRRFRTGYRDGRKRAKKWKAMPRHISDDSEYESGFKLAYVDCMRSKTCPPDRAGLKGCA